MQISFSTNSIVNFKIAEVNFEQMCNLICTHIWSPIIYQDGYRKSSNFISSEIIALDFDEGVSIEEVTQKLELANVSAVIATTKSHQIAKGDKPPCDRFRVVFTAEKCANIENYKYTMAKCVDKFKSDKSAKDAARFFYPSKEIYFICDGKKLAWMKAPVYEARPPVEIRDYNKFILPKWTRKKLTENYPTNRNNAACSLAFELAKNGVSEGEALTLISQNASLATLSQEELRRTVRNGWQAGRK